jgi:methylenetetrahydrofolate dehydrogenase (NADP+) / methenyltetrahydrofolate cyclohydrolase
MTATLIDGKAAAARLRARLQDEVAQFRRRSGRAPELRVVIVGDHPASRAYVRTKERMAGEVGIDGALVELPPEIGEPALLDEIERLNRADEVDAILVQLPLPDGIDAERVLEAVVPAKDVDGFHPMNVGRLFSSSGRVRPDLLVPCTPLGCLMLLEEALQGELRGREAVIVGRSNIVGKPMAALLLGLDCTVTVCHSKTRDLAAVCRRAEIMIAAVGRPQMIRGDWIREGATVVDVGINRVEQADGKARLVGDVAFEEASEVAGAITPVPGGVGPMTVACLLRNTVAAARARAGS